MLKILQARFQQYVNREHADVQAGFSKGSGGDRISAELFEILKDDAVKVLHSICQQIWKTAVATGLEKVSFHSNPKEGQCQRMFKLL